MIGWAIGGGWFLCSVFGFRVVFREWVDDFAPLDASDFLMGMFVSVPFGVLCGPFIVVWRCFQRCTTGADLTATARILAGESREQKLRRRESAVREREARIARLERETGVAA